MDDFWFLLIEALGLSSQNPQLPNKIVTSLVETSPKAWLLFECWVSTRASNKFGLADH